MGHGKHEHQVEEQLDHANLAAVVAATPTQQGTGTTHGHTPPINVSTDDPHSKAAPCAYAKLAASVHCAAVAAAAGCDPVRRTGKAAHPIRQAYRMGRFGSRCAVHRSLRQRLQGTISSRGAPARS
ncbi:hypothetical protein PFL02_31480 [Pseudomonas fluorescens]|nr:hypothetical protein PFL02_31480 [Pseudomonas fluorescens]